MASVGSRSNDVRSAEVETVHLLTRRRSSFPPPPPASRLVVVAAEPAQRVTPPLAAPIVTEQRDSLADLVREPDPAGWDGASPEDEDVSNIRPASRFIRRRRGIRVLGGLAIVGALVGGSYVVQQPKVRDEALSFVTLGHEEGAKRLGRRIAAIVEDLRRR
jgi:hypothetical protein